MSKILERTLLQPMFVLLALAAVAANDSKNSEARHHDQIKLFVQQGVDALSQPERKRDLVTQTNILQAEIIPSADGALVCIRPEGGEIACFRKADQLNQ